MVTIFDPLGTPTPVYNRGGTTLITMAAGPSVDPAISDGAPEIPCLSEWTVALVTTGHDGYPVPQRVILPSEADIGSVIEVYLVTTVSYQPNGLVLFPPVGTSFGPGYTINTGTTTNIGLTITDGTLFRKVDASTWRIMSRS